MTRNRELEQGWNGSAGEAQRRSSDKSVRGVVHISTKPFRYDPDKHRDPTMRKSVYPESRAGQMDSRFIKQYGWSRKSGLEPHKVRMNFLIALLDGPDVKRRSGHFVHDRNCKAINGHVDRLQVILTGITSLRSH